MVRITSLSSPKESLLAKVRTAEKGIFLKNKKANSAMVARSPISNKYKAMTYNPSNLYAKANKTAINPK
jgi:hypothetical protein